MSTTFAIHKLGNSIVLEDDYLPDDDIFGDDDDDVFIKVAFRGSSGIRWSNEVAKFLPDDLKVYPLDNSAQGIYTIGDIKKEIKLQKDVKKYNL